MNDRHLNRPDLESGFMLGPWHVQPDRLAISRGAEERHLENRLMQTLVFLADNQGQTVSREQFFDSVWQGLVVNEEALSRAISLLRNILDDSAQSPKYIQTIPGVGYRLIADVITIKDQKTTDSSTDSTPIHRKKILRSLGKPEWIIITVLVILLGFFFFEKFVFQSALDSSKPNTAQQQGQNEGDIYTENSVAIIPFVNMSSDPEQEYFADGMTEEILNLLAGVSRLRVTARTSSFFFKGRNLPIADIARTLNVKHILEGSVRKSGNRVRITAQLIEAQSDTHLWSQTYDRKLEDVFEIQDEVAGEIAAALVDSFEGLDANPVSRTNSLTAFEAYRTGRLFWWRRSPEDLMKAIELFELAIESDPGFAPAYAAVADSWLLMVFYGKTQILKGVDNARPMIDKALELDPDCVEAIAARGLSLLMIGEKDEAEKDLRKAITLDPDYIPAYAWLGTLLSDLGRVPEQGAVLQLALSMDPLNKILTSSYANNLLSRGDVDGARGQIKALLRLQPDFPTLLVDLSDIELQSGNLVEAWSAAKRAYDQAPKNTMVIIAMANAWMRLFEAGEAEKVLRAGLSHSPGNVNIKLLYLRLLMVLGRMEDAERLKSNLFPDDISWLPDAIQRTYHYETGLLNLFKENWTEAFDHLVKATNPEEPKLYDDDQVTALTIVSLLGKEMGETEFAEQRLQMAERVIGHARVNGIEDARSYYTIACIFAMRGENQRALQALQQAYDKGWRDLWLIENDGRLDSMRDEPDFLDILDQITVDVNSAREVIYARQKET